MSGEFSREHVAPASETLQQSVEDGLRRDVRDRAAAFLANGEAGSERLACADCRIAHLCGSVIAPIIEMNEGRPIAQEAIPALSAHGIEVSSDGYEFCPGKLVRAARSRLAIGDFWVAKADPLNTASTDLQLADTLRTAVEDIIIRLDTNQLI